MSKVWPPPVDVIEGMISEGISDGKIASAFNVSRKRVRTFRNKHGIATAFDQSWEPEERDLIQLLASQHLRNKEIVERFFDELPHSRRTEKAVVVMANRVRKKLTIWSPTHRRKKGEKWRTCLGVYCRGQKKFLSSGVGNRMCPRCREAAAREQAEELLEYGL